MLGLLIMLTTTALVDPHGVTFTDTPPAAAQFAYDAIEPKNRRKSPTVQPGAEDLLLDPTKRSKLTANARDIHRNFAIAGWMIRKHLDYVATFEFHCRTGDDSIDLQVEGLMDEWSRPYHCDVAGRHGFHKILRLAEARRIVDGDVGLLKLSTGQLQAIEGDRIRDPMGQGPFVPAEPKTGTRWVHGVKVNEAGRAMAYALHRRTGLSSYAFERTIPAGNLCLHGFFDRFDQVRGVSPIAAALNPLRDVYENFEYALAKAKVEQLFALILFRAAEDSAGLVSGGTDESGAEKKNAYEVDFGRGPIKLDLDPGDDAKFLQSQHPSSQFQEFTTQMLAVAMKALDLPFSFYDEAHTNFFGSRAAWLHYERSCVDKRRDLLDLLRRLTVWRLALWVLDGELVLPAGKTIRDIAFEWVPMGMPWWDPAKEIKGDLAAIAAGLDNPQRVTKERGRGDWYDNVDQIAEAQQYAEKKGVKVSFVPEPEPPAVEVTSDA